MSTVQLTRNQLNQIFLEMAEIQNREEAYYQYLRESSSISDEEGRSFGGLCRDNSIELNHAMDKGKIQQYQTLLDDYEIIREYSSDKIGINTKFSIVLDDEEEVIECTLVVPYMKTSSAEGIFSSSSELGKSLLGKKVDDVFETSKIKGTVVKIYQDKAEVARKFRNQHQSLRKSKGERKKRTAIRNSLSDKEFEYKSLFEITASQERLLKHELFRLEERDRKSYKDSEEQRLFHRRKTEVEKILSRPIAELPLDDSIGIGSKFSMLICDGEKLSTVRVELINHAVSDETNDIYLERIGLLGGVVFGLKNGEEFISRISRNKYVSGKVFDIDNNKEHVHMHVDALTYQKIKGKNRKK